MGSGRRWIAVPSAKQTLEQNAGITVGPAAHELYLSHLNIMGHVNGHYLKFSDFSSETTSPEIEHMGFAELITSNESIENVATMPSCCPNSPVCPPAHGRSVGSTVLPTTGLSLVSVAIRFFGSSPTPGCC
jgi:hypothetical protein